MKPLFFVIFSALLAGFVSPPEKVKSDVVGYYTMTQGGFNEWMSVELADDGSYILNHKVFMCVIGPNGEMPINYSKEEGTWRFDGEVILLEPKAQTKDFPDSSVFVPSLTRRLLPKMDGFIRVLVNADFPDRMVMKKTKKPSAEGRAGL